MPLAPTLLASPALALSCLIVHVQDGDTLSADCAPAGIVLPTEQRPRRDEAGTYTAAIGSSVRYRIRLAEVDAPEDGQPFGAESRKTLVAMCFQKKALIWLRTTDRYGRQVARVECDGHDAGADLVRAGMAWVFERYSTDRELRVLQDKAKDEGAGLWAD